MKNSVLVLAVLVFCVPALFAGFDQTISNTYEFGVVVEYDMSLLVTGGGAYDINADDSSYIEVRDTAPLQENIGGIYALDLIRNSTLNYFGGEMGGLTLRGDAIAVLQGGSINYISSYQDITSGPHIEIICNDYEYFDDYAIEYGDPIDLLRIQWGVSGDWIDIKLVDQEGYAPVIDNIFFTPEPASLVLLGIGGLLLRRKRG